MNRKHPPSLIREIGVLHLNGEKLTELSRRYKIPYETLRSAKKRGFDFRNYQPRVVGLAYAARGEFLDAFDRVKIRFKQTPRYAWLLK